MEQVIQFVPPVMCGFGIGCFIFSSVFYYEAKYGRKKVSKDAVTYDDFDLLRSECIDSKQRGPQNLFVTGTVQQEGDHFIKATNAIVSPDIADDKEYFIGPGRMFFVRHKKKSYNISKREWREYCDSILTKEITSVPFLLRDCNGRTITILKIHDSTDFYYYMSSQHEVYKHIEPVPQYSTTLDVGSRITKYDIGKETSEYLLQFGSPITIYGHIEAITEDSLVISPRIVGVSANTILERHAATKRGEIIISISLAISGVLLIAGAWKLWKFLK